MRLSCSSGPPVSLPLLHHLCQPRDPDTPLRLLVTVHRQPWLSDQVTPCQLTMPRTSSTLLLSVFLTSTLSSELRDSSPHHISRPPPEDWQHWVPSSADLPALPLSVSPSIGRGINGGFPCAACSGMTETQDIANFVYIRPYKALCYHTRPYKTIQGHTGPYKATHGQTRPRKAKKCHIRPQKAIKDHARPYKAIQGQTRQYKAIQGHTRPNNLLNFYNVIQEYTRP